MAIFCEVVFHVGLVVFGFALGFILSLGAKAPKGDINE